MKGFYQGFEILWPLTTKIYSLGDFRGTSKLEDAAEMYISAGNMFKMAQKWSGKLKSVLLLVVIV